MKIRAVFIRRFALSVLAVVLASAGFTGRPSFAAGNSLPIRPSPTVELTTVPPYRSETRLEGRATGADPAAWAVAVYIYMAGWWTKPSWEQPVTPIRADGTWSCDISTYENDPFATRIAVFLVPKSYTPPLAAGEQALPTELTAKNFPRIIVDRPPIYRAIEFSGYEWLVKFSPIPVGPGPNYFSDRSDDVWVDDGGRLHLRIGRRFGRWFSTEVFTAAPMGYGIYTFTLAEPIDQLDNQAVVGFFTWEDDVPQYNFREIDIELSRWSIEGNDNAQFVVQPWIAPGNLFRFNLEGREGCSTHRIDWRPAEIRFRSFYGRPIDPGPEAASWVYTGADIPPAGGSRARINLWLIDGKPPTNGREAEVIVESFSFEPFKA